jgi:cytochrome oxidase assembly protein ShyY1
MEKNVSFFKIFSFLLCIIFFILSGWQMNRFFSKKNKFFEIKKAQDELLISKHQIFNKNLAEEFKKNNDSFCFKKIIACGVLKPEESFILYNSGKGDNQNIYKMIMPIENKDLGENFLFIYDSFDEKQDAFKKISEIKERKFEYSCFSGILTKIPIEKKTNFLQKISDFNGFQKNQNNYEIKNAENASGIKIINFKITKEELKKINLDSEKINFLIDPNELNFNFVNKNYKHHFFYMLMWFGIAIYIATRLIYK